MPNAIAGRNKAVQATAKRAKPAHLWVVVGEADEAEALDEQWRALVPQGATQHSLALWDAVALDVWSGVAVGVALKGKGRVHDNRADALGKNVRCRNLNLLLTQSAQKKSVCVCVCVAPSSLTHTNTSTCAVHTAVVCIPSRAQSACCCFLQRG